MKNKRLWIIFIVILAISIGGDLGLMASQAHACKFWWSNIPGFFALFGFIGCLAIIIIAKFAAHHWLQRKEDYYGSDDDDN